MTDPIYYNWRDSRGMVRSAMVRPGEEKAAIAAAEVEHYGAPTCRTCAHWSPYLPGLGECLEYVKRRQEAFARADDVAAFKAEWPAKAADDTPDTHTCEKHEADDA